MLALARPDVVTASGEAYLAAGSDIGSTNTFSANRISQADYGAEHLVADINHERARLGREAADRYQARDGRRRFIAGAVGTKTKPLAPSPEVTNHRCRENDFHELHNVSPAQDEALAAGGADFHHNHPICPTRNPNI